MQDKWNKLSNETKLEIWQKFNQEQPDYFFEENSRGRAFKIKSCNTDRDYYPIEGYYECYTINGYVHRCDPIDDPRHLEITPLIEWAEEKGYFYKPQPLYLGAYQSGDISSLFLKPDYLVEKNCKNIFKLTYINGDLQVEKIK